MRVNAVAVADKSAGLFRDHIIDHSLPLVWQKSPVRQVGYGSFQHCTGWFSEGASTVRGVFVPHSPGNCFAGRLWALRMAIRSSSIDTSAIARRRSTSKSLLLLPALTLGARDFLLGDYPFVTRVAAAAISNHCSASNFMRNFVGSSGASSACSKHLSASRR